MQPASNKPTDVCKRGVEACPVHVFGEGREGEVAVLEDVVDGTQGHVQHRVNEVDHGVVGFHVHRLQACVVHVHALRRNKSKGTDSFWSSCLISNPDLKLFI